MVLRRFREEESPQLTNDQRKRVAQVNTMGDYKALHDYGDLYFDEVVNGATSTYSVGNGGYELDLANTSGYAIRQTRAFHRYISGNNQLVEITADKLELQTNVVKRAGYFSSITSAPYTADRDGFYFESDGSNGVYKFVLAKGGVLQEFERDNWNQDKLDGNGDSGFTIDFSKFNVFVIDFLYLGGAGVRYGFIVNGILVWCHIYVHASLGSGVFVNSPQQPIRYEVRAEGGLGSMVCICSRVGSEGEAARSVGNNNIISNGATKVDLPTSGTYYGLLGLRLRPDRRNMMIEPLGVSFLPTSANRDYYWEIRLRPTVTGAWDTGWTNVSSFSSGQYALGLNGTRPTITGGEIITGGYGASDVSIDLPIKTILQIGSNIDGSLDELILCATPATGSSNVDLSGSLVFQDFH